MAPPGSKLRYVNYDFSGAVRGYHEGFRRSSADAPQGVPHRLCRFDQIRHEAFVDVRRPLVLRQISALMGLGEDPPPHLPAARV